MSLFTKLIEMLTPKVPNNGSTNDPRNVSLNCLDPVDEQTKPKKNNDNIDRPNMNEPKSTNVIRKINEAGLNLIKSFEGLRLETYLDAVGVRTIGYGHTGPEVTSGLHIDKSYAEELLRSDIKRFERGVMALVSVALTDNQFSALVSFSFNLGLNNLKNSTLLRKLNSGQNIEAANEFPRWNRAGGKILAGLTRRREAEKALFLRG
jgi:lysozyme